MAYGHVPGGSYPQSGLWFVYLCRSRYRSFWPILLLWGCIQMMTFERMTFLVNLTSS